MRGEWCGEVRMRLGCGVAVRLVVLAAVIPAATACNTGRDRESVAATAPPCGQIDYGLYPRGSTVDRLHTAGRLRVGIKYDSPGVGYRDPHTGKVSGFDIEIVKLVACRLGVADRNIEWIEAPARSREKLITSNAVDIVVATYAINDERRKLVSYAGPYFLDGQTLMVRRSDVAITGPDAVRGRRVCSTQGSVTLDEIKLYRAKAVAAASFFDCVDLLLHGKVEAVTGLDAILIGLLGQFHNQVKIVGPQFTVVRYGIGLRRSDATFRRFLDDVLQRAFDDGSWRRAYDQTLGRNGIGAPYPPALMRY